MNKIQETIESSAAVIKELVSRDLRLNLPFQQFKARFDSYPINQDKVAGNYFGKEGNNAEFSRYKDKSAEMIYQEHAQGKDDCLKAYSVERSTSLTYEQNKSQFFAQNGHLTEEGSMMKDAMKAESHAMDSYASKQAESPSKDYVQSVSGTVQASSDFGGSPQQTHTIDGGMKR